MTTEYTGRGDPQRSMDLLWGATKPPTRGPKPGLTTERIVRAAIEVADADGLAALSMRRVADRLGVGAMSLVPGKTTTSASRRRGRLKQHSLRATRA